MPAPQNDSRRAALVKGASKAKIKALINLDACTGCEVCIAVCPVPSCIEKFGDDVPAAKGVYVNYDICIGCNLCAKDCPWDTIRMVPTPTVAMDQTSLDSQLTHDHAVFQSPELVPEELRGFVNKAPKEDPAVLELFGKQNPVVPGLMSPK
ncbi:MAG: 4Fe-4S dicluster domain-containing protein [Elusimicrobia bacterium]|nr:4Fe-4S dicluster domain-containing protein [Elusimicrobiota bacterium]